MKSDCPFRNEIMNTVIMKIAPICFHCGNDYVRDLKHCGTNHNTWMPDCKCLSTSAVRIVTGNSSNDVDEDFGNEWLE